MYLRKMKERSGMSQMRQLSNIVRFGQVEDTTSDGAHTFYFYFVSPHPLAPHPYPPPSPSPLPFP